MSDCEYFLSRFLFNFHLQTDKESYSSERITLSLMILHNSSARINKVLKSLSASASILSDVSKLSSSVPGVLPLFAHANVVVVFTGSPSPGSAGRCPRCLMSVEMVVRRRRDTRPRDQIPPPPPPLPVLTPADARTLQRILPAPPAASHHSVTQDPTQWFLAPGLVTTLSLTVSSRSTQSLLTTEH